MGATVAVSGNNKADINCMIEKVVQLCIQQQINYNVLSHLVDKYYILVNKKFSIFVMV